MAVHLMSSLGTPTPKLTNDLGQEINFIAFSEGLSKWNNELLSDTYLEDIWDSIVNHASSAPNNESSDSTWPRLTYAAFRDVAAELNLSTLLTPTLFLRFPQDEEGRIQARALHRYLRERTRLHHNAISILQAVGRCTEYLSDDDVMQWLREGAAQSPHITHEMQLHDFEEFYLYMAHRRVVLHLSKGTERYVQQAQTDMRTGTREGTWGNMWADMLQRMPPLTRVMLSRLALSPIYDEFVAACRGTHSPRNWFSPANMADLYNTYIRLDRDCDGLLTLDELAPLYDCAIPRPVLRAVMAAGSPYTTPQEDGTVAHPVDFKVFVDIVLAIEYPAHAASIRFWFLALTAATGALPGGCLDRRGVSQLALEMAVHVRELQGELPDGVTPALLADDIFHLCDRAHADTLVLADFLECEQGHVALGLLCNWHAWYAFESREGTDMFQVPPTFLFNAPAGDDQYY